MEVFVVSVAVFRDQTVTPARWLSRKHASRSLFRLSVLKATHPATLFSAGYQDFELAPRQNLSGFEFLATALSVLKMRAGRMPLTSY